MQADPRRGQVSLDQATEDLITLTNDCQQQLVETAEKIATAQSSFDLQKSQLTALAEANQRQSRRSRLISKQLAALRWLESLVAQPPRAGDAVAAWLNPRIAGHLEAAGLFTLAQLLERVNGVGRGWTSSIKGIGTAKAERVVQWLIQNEATIGMGVGRHVALPRSALYRHIFGHLDSCGDPVLAFSPDGSRLYFAGLVCNFDKFPRQISGVAVAVSQDGGAHWDAPVMVHSAASGDFFQDKEWIGVGNDGTVFLTWTRFFPGAARPGLPEVADRDGQLIERRQVVVVGEAGLGRRPSVQPGVARRSPSSGPTTKVRAAAAPAARRSSAPHRIRSSS